MSKILQSLEYHSGALPERTAITGSTVSLTWRELNNEVAGAAASLQHAGMLGLLMSNSPAWIVTDLAAMHAGVTTIPLSGFFSDDQLLHAIQDAQVDALITDQPDRVRTMLDCSVGRPVEVASKQCVLFDLSIRDSSKTNGTAKITYTSGTTGSPRGVRLTLHEIETVAESLAAAANASPDDRALALLPLSILLENIGSVYVPIMAGAEILVPDDGDSGVCGSSHVDAETLAGFLYNSRPTTMILPPQLLKLMVALEKRQLLPDSFRYIAVGGAPVGIELLDAARELELPVYQGYGLSEACSVIAVNTQKDNRMGSVGRPLKHNRVRISTDGEIIIQGETFAGYLNETGRDQTTELATGDLGCLDEDGYLYVTGRCCDRIITGYGRNVSPEWVESELLSRPLIAQAVVLGNGLPYLVAVIVPAVADEPAAVRAGLDREIEAVNERLPDYARVGQYLIADSPFSVASGELGVSGSPCRAGIVQHYSDRVRNMTAERNGQIL